VQAANAPLSTLHVNDVPAVELKANVAPVAVVGFAGPELIDASGAVLSTVTVTVLESVVKPTLSVARATIVYVPSIGCEFHVYA
jgi:hypothetical protein